MYNFRNQFASNWLQPSFSPRSLFAASEAGFWGAVQPSALWQDVARTTPVTAAGQSVLSWQLNTASGVIYATQATAGNAPTYQVDINGRGHLLFDGVDDWLETPAVNFSGTDKVTVIAGLRKLSDAARGIVVELGVSAVSAAFLIDAPGPTPASQRYRFASIGTSASVPETAVGPAPDTAVITGLGDIVGDSAILRRNGVQVNASATDQGTGNFGNAIVYIGRRGGTTLPFSGRIYGLIARGAITSGSQLSAAEAWMNRQTAAY